MKGKNVFSAVLEDITSGTHIAFTRVVYSQCNRVSIHI